MTLEEWIVLASGDARARGLDALVPALEGLARATAELRAADWNDWVAGQPLDAPPSASQRAPRHDA